MRELQNRVKEQWALIRRTDQANTRLAVFIHGFKGGYLDTWGRLPDLLRSNADQQAPFDAWDYLFLGYDTADVDAYLDIARLLETAVAQALAGESPYNQPYSHIALFGHSLGTLGIRQFLCAWCMQPPNFLASLKSVVLFGSPINGSPWAVVGALRYRIAEALKPQNPQLRMLKRWTESAFQNQPWTQTRLILGLNDKVVGYEAADLIEWPGEVQRTTNFDHRDLSKPDSWTASVVVDEIRNALR